ncbi:MAG TPA: galactose-1-epimerase [Gemmatimonadales bacterium]|nr:galactose-1-epimerase [Gemmatimonadales bacterium]
MLLLLFALAASVASAQSRLVTRWAAAVDTLHPLPEYPRPEMRRSSWLDLNGPWDYAIQDGHAARPEHWDGRIVVPFAVESQLSGVRRPVLPSQALWYRRRVEVRPAAGTRWLLHFGAVDWSTTVWVNGKVVGRHVGGYDPFTFDVTAALAPSGSQEIVVQVTDPTDSGGQPRGKQVLKPGSIWYTAVTGIWQTVWLEPVPVAHIERLGIVPDLADGRVRVTVHAEGVRNGIAAVRIFAGDSLVSMENIPAGRPTDLRLRHPRPWSPDDPYLYRIQVSLGHDTVRGQFGMRSIAVRRDAAGTLRLFLNGRPLFEYGLLDQGWWPDGLYTAPTEPARLNDLVTIKSLGFNLLRKHVKVEPARWYYDCDSLGILVWQDMPSADNRTAAERTEFRKELSRVVDALDTHPSIVMWVPFNEGWGQWNPAATREVTAWLKRRDPSRLVDDASGWTDAGVGDVHDIHTYPGPDLPVPDPHRALVVGEFGGLGLPLAGHTWQDQGSWGYRRFGTLDSLGDAYTALIEQLRRLEGAGVAAAVYTQLSDVEVEVNGIMTYDRAVVKLPASAPHLHQLLVHAPPTVRPLLPAGPAGVWRYTTDTPDSGWAGPGFDDHGWRVGHAPFGDSADIPVATRWSTSDIWLRRPFTLADTSWGTPYLRLAHDDAADVYLNGSLVGHYDAWTSSYRLFPFDVARAGLHAGANLVAVHVHQDRGGQVFDLGIDAVTDTAAPRISAAPFGRTPDGQDVTAYTLDNGRGMTVRAMTYGATILSIRVPDAHGAIGDVTLGFDSLAPYLTESPYFGAVVGRYANRIARGRFTLDGREYQLAINNAPNALHGGLRGFDKVVWHAVPFRHGDSVGVAFTYVSPDGDQGYPGTLTVHVTYTLTPDDRLAVDYDATTDRATVLNLSQHTYFNLAGEGSGDVLAQELTLHASHYTPVDSTLIPTGVIAPVAGTPFDFRSATAIGSRIALPDTQLAYGHGYDHNFVLDRDGPGLVPAARAVDPVSGRTLEISTDQPGIQFYTGNFLDGTIHGKAGHVYVHRGAFCLETQHFPDSPNHPGFPSTVLRPGERFTSRTVYRFGTTTVSGH